MKITNDLRNIIKRKVMDMEKDELSVVRKQRDAVAKKLEEQFKASEEYKAYTKACEAVEKLYNKYVEENAPIIANGYGRPTRFDFFFRGDDKDVFKKYQAMEDALILKLSYGKDLEECVKILAEFGISL